MTNYKCVKCNCLKYRKGEAWLAGSFWKRILNIENRHFTTITCVSCGYTELHEKQAVTASEKRREKVEEVLEVLVD
ncbi:hypothetical protein A3H75_00075 [Candidatus Uhrbacteria bacterium RIFCSPLOWO2_02_FULL_51_9]|uniref:GTP-binding protein n=1 Tax=Candidatus Uhrbacteria bacterium RIFCSPLOWO2_02_FULL_51_9 TaxID=1802410 RepID=A0A1F7VG64_9BACT|nr:MAG: hypothetical protein A3H75_00075 [Candidatus Uhrbacteria bacterium RIFCSPLOWO2_02_FULL_51_9]